MASGITRQDSMVSGRGMVPWHNDPNCTVVQGLLSAKECIEKSGLNWRVGLHHLMTVDGYPVPGSYAVMREDTKEVFSVQSDGYMPVQNEEAFWAFDSVVGSGKAIYDTAGSLKGGRIVFVSALTSEFEVVPGDLVKQYLLLSNSHDGSLAFRMGFTDVRVVCANTHGMALSRLGEKGFTHKHTTNIGNRVYEASQVLGFMNKARETVEEEYVHLAGLYPTPDEIDDVLAKLWPVKKEESERSEENAQKSREGVLKLYNESPTCNIPGMEGTGWALYNAMTEFSQYTSKPNQNSETRLYGQMYGSSADFSEKALQTCLQTIR